MAESENIQRTIFQLLQAALTPQGVTVYDHLPENRSYPHVVIGDDTLSDWSTDTETGVDVVLTIHTYSNVRGKRQVRRIMDAMKAALHNADPPVEDYETVLLQFQQDVIVEESDGVTWHGISRYRYLADEVEST